MRTISKVKIKNEDFELTVEKMGTIQGLPPVSSTSKVSNTMAAPGMASPAQVKFARDLIRKVFGNDETASLDFLAHTLEILLEEIPDIETWDTSLTIEMVSAIIDALEPMLEKTPKGYKPKGGD